jgi:peptide/nickel transport system substrate-binding protein
MPSVPAWSWILKPFNILFRFLAYLEQLLYILREFLWNYPDLLLFGPESLRAKFQVIYSALRPHSHVFLAIVSTIFLLLTTIFLTNANVSARNGLTLIEGVVMGVDVRGQTQRLSRINPLIPTSIQLEKDINELVYEPLIRYQQDGTVVPVLAERVLRIEEGSRYGFDLRHNVYWHDGTLLTVDDVIATLRLIKSLDDERWQSTTVQAVKQMGWELSGQHSIIICTLSAADNQKFINGELPRPCSVAADNRPIFSNFLELIGVKIMSERWIKDLNTLNIAEPGPAINQRPIGTGPFKFANANSENITVIRNEDYHGTLPSIAAIKFRMFASEDVAIRALQNGEIHSYATFATQNLADTQQFPQVLVSESAILLNQYWGIYFNMRTAPDGKALGPTFFQQKEVRQAINLAINKPRVLAALYNIGSVAQGPIAENTEFHNADVKWAAYNPGQARDLLDKAGWVVGSDGIRAKDGRRLSFELTYIGTPDRQKTVASIKQDLAQVGIELIENNPNSASLINEVVLGSQFEALLYGVQTFIDPDRYELFHSSQKTGLNLAGYTGSQETKQIKDGKVVSVPRVDRILEVARSLDPLQAKQLRIDNYKELQSLLYDDMPVIFLYRPQFIYYHNRRISFLPIDKASSLEQRFVQISEWQI